VPVKRYRSPAVEFLDWALNTLVRGLLAAGRRLRRAGRWGVDLVGGLIYGPAHQTTSTTARALALMGCVVAFVLALATVVTG
jgi:hypothetical protein